MGVSRAGPGMGWGKAASVGSADAESVCARRSLFEGASGSNTQAMFAA